MFKRIINGVFCTLLIGALMVGAFVWLALLTQGPWYMSVIFTVLALSAFSFGYNAEGGGNDRDKDEETSGI